MIRRAPCWFCSVNRWRRSTDRGGSSHCQRVNINENKESAQRKDDVPGHDVREYSFTPIRGVCGVFHLAYVTQSYVGPAKQCQNLDAPEYESTGKGALAHIVETHRAVEIQPPVVRIRKLPEVGRRLALICTQTSTITTINAQNNKVEENVLTIAIELTRTPHRQQILARIHLVRTKLAPWAFVRNVG